MHTALPHLPKLICLIILSTFWAGSPLQGQTIRINTNDNVSTCTGNFVDSGSLFANHSTGTEQSITICSNGAAPNTHVRIDFEELRINGTLTVYNDDNSMDPADIIAVYNTDDSGTFPTIAATAGNSTGCLTFVFIGIAPADQGWNGIINCQQPCQPVVATLFSADPEVMPVDTGYIDVCLFDTVTLVGGGTYPENNLVYNQSDATSTLEWFFTDGTEIVNENVIQRVFTEPGGYIVNLRVTDQRGCESTNQIRQRIRVAPRPTFNLQVDFVQEICSNDTITLAGSTEINPNPGSEIFVSSDSVGFPVALSVADTTFLPDGNDEIYQSTLTFSGFEPGATLTSLDDLIGICLNMEHSYAGDLDLYIECPNGATAVFIDFAGPGLGGQYLGIPIDIDADLSPGVGYDYCFVPDPTLLSIAEEAIQNGTDANGSIPAGNYNADDFAEWNNLLGCPLNGDWTIFVQDNLLSDNGYIFSWSIEFTSTLYPNAETFFVGIEDDFWNETDDLLFYQSDSIVALGTFSGTNAFRYTVVDSFGCVYDTTLTVEVNPFSSPGCYDCQPLLDTTEQNAVVCSGSDLQTTLASRTTVDTLIPWAAFPYDTFTNASHPSLGNAFNSVITVSDVRPLSITDATVTIESVCVNIETENTGDIRLFLQAPGGGLFELSTGNGNGPNFTATCFTPSAVTPITAGTAPFTGDFLPETDFSFLNGSTINGDWTLRAYDVAGGTTYGEFINWSITFRHQNPITYSWTPDDGNLSCTDCPNPVISASGDVTYNVVATDIYGCTENGTVNITLGDLPADIMVDVTNPGCGQSTGSATVDVDPTAGFQFTWSHGPTTQTVNNLDPGDYTVTISAGSCETTRDITVIGGAAINTTIESVTNVSCFGAGDGQIDVTVTGGAGNLTFAWDDPNLQILEDAVFLQAGTYSLTITDENGCRDSITATVTQPDSLELSFTSDDVDCNGGSDGSATVTATGGNGGYTFAWETGVDTPTASDLAAGTYVITVVDNEGCTTVDSVSVGEPAAAVSLTILQDQMGCNGQSQNTASVNALGGQPPYDYAWSNGDNTPTATNLPAGMATVTVTDGSGCGTTIEIELMDLAPISFNIFATSPTCNGSTDGALGVNQLTGGAGTSDADYSFNWSSGSQDIIAMNLVGGVEYSLTVTDQQGCSAVESRLLEQPEPITLATTQTSVSCFGLNDGSISIVEINGPNAGPYDILWDAAANNATDSTVTDLTAGVYTVLITDNEGCEADLTAIITEPTQLEVTLDQVDVTCFGDIDGELQAVVSGGTPDYTYNWSTGSSTDNIGNLAAGNYQLILTDANGCEEIRQTTIQQPPEVLASAMAEDVICNGDATGRIMIAGDGGRPPFTYGLQGTGFSQSNEFIGLPAGTYDVFVRDIGGCLGTTEITVNDGPVFSVDLGEDQQIVFGDSIDLSGSFTGAAGQVFYAWTGSYDGTLACAGDSLVRELNTTVFCPRPNAKPEYEIDYFLRLVDENGCEAEDRVRISVQKIRVVEVPTGFTPNNDGQNDRLIVHGRPGTTIKRFSIFDRWGELIFEDNDFAVNDFTKGWDGNYQQEPSSGGVYVWQLLVEYEDGSEELLQGQTSLIR